jgi:molybdenum cofactor cytidylyltransferase
MRSAPENERPRVLMLAAGSSRRFGADKRRRLLQGRETLLQKSLASYRQNGLQVVLCLSDRPEDDDLARELAAADVECLRCRRAAAGMGATLAEGVRYCAAEPGILVALADMPLIAPGTIGLLAGQLARDQIVYPVFRGRRGHPVLFGARFLPELCLLDGDRGASAVIAAHASHCREVAVDDPGVLLDADTPAALADIRRRLQLRSDAGVSGCREG